MLEETKEKIRELSCLFLKFTGNYEIKEEVTQEQVDAKFREVILSAFPKTTEEKLEASYNAFKYSLDKHLASQDEKVIVTEAEFKTLIDERIGQVENFLDTLITISSSSNQNKVTSEVTCH